MKQILLAVVLLLLASILAPQTAYAQCGKCVPSLEPPFNDHCQRGPLAPPAQKDCEDRLDGSCWEHSQSCYEEFAVEGLRISPWGSPILVAVSVVPGFDTSTLLSCGGLVLAIRYHREAADAFRDATDHLIV